MGFVQKIMLFMGVIYVLIGGVVGIFFVVAGSGIFVLIPLIFVVLGLGFILGVWKSVAKKKEIITKGKKYTGKIYGYVENTSYTVNDRYTINVKVRYFDENRIEREAVLPTGTSDGNSQYPVGMTIDFFEYKGKYCFDEKSVRNEILSGEAELMDNKPLEPDKITVVAVECPNCGASFRAMKGYTERCPYCGSYHNV